MQDKVNNWFWSTAGGENRKAFLDVDEVYPALRRIDGAYADIRREALALVDNRDALPTLHETDASQGCVSNATPHNWRVLYLTAGGLRVQPNRVRCPATSAALDSVPGVFQAWFSILDPGKSVPAHRGPFAGYLRYHLALVVPTENPPQLRVKDELYTWREGESVLFDDSHEHEVFNTSTEPRVVLIIDVARPMPFPQSWANWGAIRVAQALYGRRVRQRALDRATA